MNFYPDLPLARLRAILFDVTMVLLLWLCWLVGSGVHEAVNQLDVLGRGVERAGNQVDAAFEKAGEAVDRTPVVGERLERALGSAGDSTSEPVVEAGQRGRRAVADLADVLGWVTGGLPALILLLRFVPSRIERARGILGARRVLGGTDSPERRRLLAMRAAFALPFSTLLAHTRDPIGDLENDNLEPLLAALADEYGVRPMLRA
ncbi:MAG: hypothetical protein JWM90_344 [Thermoleophilia bacterium]|nr:hypothetical protein [Thermoleophilia bacterium]